MTQIPYELLVRFSPTGTVAGASVRYLYSLNGKTIEGDPVPLSGITDPVFTDFAGQFSAAVVAERDTLVSDKQTLQGQIAALEGTLQGKSSALENVQQQLTGANEQIEDLQSQVQTLQGQVVVLDGTLQQLDEANKQTQSLQSQVEGLQGHVQGIEGQLAAAQARIEQLAGQLPFSPRVMEATAFLARLSPGEVLQLMRSQDQNVQAFGVMLDEYVKNDWPVVLDSPEMQQAMAYFVAIGIVTEERKAQLLQDCTREGAYVADQSVLNSQSVLGGGNG